MKFYVSYNFYIMIYAICKILYYNIFILHNWTIKKIASKIHQ